MERFFGALIKKKILIPVIFGIITIASLLLLPLVSINYDMSAYLPEKAGTKQAIIAAKAEFDYPGTAEVMAQNITIQDAATLKQRIKAIPGVKSVLWLDDVADITQPVNFIPTGTVSDYYKDGNALFHVEFTGDDYANATTAAITQIKALGPNLIAAGNAETSSNTKSILNSEIPGIVAILLPICLLILVLSSLSWVEPLLYILVLGVSVAINLGTNAFFTSISFITNAMAALLQFAISMDFSIFLMHRYREEREKGSDTRQAVVTAASKTLSSISSSALTAISGFAALLFMQYRIGADLGLVLIKGITISLISVIILMPVLILLFSKALDKTKHRSFLPSFKNIGKASVKLRYGIIALVILMVIPAFLAQSSNQFVYGDNSASAGSGQVYENRMKVIHEFGVSNPVMVLVPKGDTQSEVALTGDLQTLPQVQKVLALVNLAGPVAPSFLPQTVKDTFESEHYSRMIVYLNTDGETPQSYEAARSIRALAQKYYPDQWYAAGSATSLADIKDTVTQDSGLVTALSLAAVGIIILIVFRSLSIPAILLFSIQSAVWVNMSLPYFSGYDMAYIGYLIVSALQLGATINYGILLTRRYFEFRSALLPPREAAISAVKTAGLSIVVSALVLASTGLTFGIVSHVDTVTQMGILIGRGTLISCVLTLLLLPSLLTVLDKVIMKTTIKMKPKRSETE